MSGTHRSADPQADAARPAPQWNPIGSQAEGMEAIRAVWERAGEVDRRRRPPAPPKGPRRFAPSLLGILVCACLLMFFAWVSAPALWMSMGHSQAGTVAVTSCSEGFAPGCSGTFEAGGWTKELRLTGGVSAADVGSSLPARATGPDTSSAYVGGNAGLMLRWAPGLVLFMACGFALAATSGATRLYERRGAAIGLCWVATGAVLAVAMGFAW